MGHQLAGGNRSWCPEWSPGPHSNDAIFNEAKCKSMACGKRSSVSAPRHKPLGPTDVCELAYSAAPAHTHTHTRTVIATRRLSLINCGLSLHSLSEPITHHRSSPTSQSTLSSSSPALCACMQQNASDQQLPCRVVIGSAQLMELSGPLPAETMRLRSCASPAAARCEAAPQLRARGVRRAASEGHTFRGD